METVPSFPARIRAGPSLGRGGRCSSLGSTRRQTPCVSTALGAGRQRGAYGYRFPWKSKHRSPWGKTESITGQPHARNRFSRSLLPEHFQGTVFQHPLKRETAGFCSLPQFLVLNLALWDSLVRRSVLSLQCFFPSSSAAEWVCLIPSKITGNLAFRLGHQKQYEGKRRIKITTQSL